MRKLHQFVDAPSDVAAVAVAVSQAVVAAVTPAAAPTDGAADGALLVGADDGGLLLVVLLPDDVIRCRCLVVQAEVEVDLVVVLGMLQLCDGDVYL